MASCEWRVARNKSVKHLATRPSYRSGLGGAEMTTSSSIGLKTVTSTRSDFDMNVNFFEWLRDGVRQSVLLGVSDAIEQIGTPADSDELHPNVAALLHGETSGGKTKRGGAGGGRKRLGKSLKEMDTTK